MSRFSGGEYREGVRGQRQLDIEKRRELSGLRKANIEIIVSLKEQRRNTRNRDERDTLKEQIDEVQSYINELTAAINELTDEIDIATDILNS